MNNYFKNYRSLSSVLISGGRQSGKLTFALYFASQLTQKPVALISPFSQDVFNKKRKESSWVNSNLQPVLEGIDTFHFRESWKVLKKRYGYGFLIKDIEKIINRADEFIIFHRLDKFFEIDETNEIENFLFNVLTIVQAEEKKIIFTFKTGDSRSRYMRDYFDKNIDSEFVISKRPYNNKARDVEMVFSLFSVKHSSFSFELDDGAKKIIFTPRGQDEGSDNKIKTYRVVLASRSSKLIGIVKYLFGIDNFKLKLVDSTLPEMIKAINGEPQLIIFNPLEDQSVTELEKISKVVRNSNIKVIFISSRLVMRRQDKAEILRSGFCDVLARELYIEDFILSVERALGQLFYSSEMKKVPNKTFVIYDKKTFSRLLVSFLCKHLFFTVFKFKYQLSLSEDDIRKNLGRSFDAAFINKSEKVIYLFLVNTTAVNADVIEAKFSEIDPKVQMLGFKEAAKYSLDFQKK